MLNRCTAEPKDIHKGSPASGNVVYQNVAPESNKIPGLIFCTKNVYKYFTGHRIDVILQSVGFTLLHFHCIVNVISSKVVADLF